MLVRSSSESRKDAVCSSLESIFSLAGGKVEIGNGYNGWQPNINSPILHLMKDVYQNLFGKEPAVKVMHAGLECGIIQGIYPDMDMVSIGPDLQHPHSPDERVSISSVARTWEFIKNVLENIDLHIKSGETVGIIGATGSGKSSLVNLISRLYDVDSGCVKVGGIDVRKYDVETLRDSVAVVLQKNVLFSGTILENLRWGNEKASEEECKEALELASADEFVENFPDKYNTYIEQGGTNVSGGQRQRLCIARALMKKPKILILDDSTSAVDTATDAKIWKALSEKISETTKLIVSQRISSIESADRVIVLDSGHVDAFDTPENLLKTNAIYREVALAQSERGGDFDQE